MSADNVPYYRRPKKVIDRDVLEQQMIARGYAEKDEAERFKADLEDRMRDAAMKKIDRRVG